MKPHGKTMLRFVKQDANLLSLYYEIFGENNKYNVDYNNGFLTYTDEFGEKAELEAPNKLIQFLEDAKSEFETLKQNKTSQAALTTEITIPSSREKFNKRYQKYQEMIEHSQPSTNM